MVRSPVRSLGLIGMAVLIGILGDVLLRDVRWGINFPIWLAVAVVGGWATLPDNPEKRIRSWPFVAALGFASFTAIRDSEFLMVWNIFAILVALSIPALEIRGIRLAAATATDCIVAGVHTGFSVARGFVTPVTRSLAWGELGRFRGSAGSVAIGAALSVPILLVFGGLLMSADRGFENTVTRVLNVNLDSVYSHVFLTGFLTWITAGYLASLLAPRKQKPDRPQIPLPGLGIVEIGIPLGVVALLFTSFMALQLNYLFGGEEAMRAAGMTFAEYAREGFQQLAMASALVVPLLLSANALFKKRTARHERIFGVLEVTVVGLVGALMISAFHRIAMYVGQYGLTEIRLYASVFMVWLAAVHGILLVTVLRGTPGAFAIGSVVSGFAVLAALNLANPDAIITRSHFSHAARTEAFDTEYLSRLSADGVPAAVQRLGSISRESGCDLWTRRLRRWSAASGSDWRGWNLSRARARAAAERAAERFVGCVVEGLN